MPGIAADVRHQHIDVFYAKTIEFAERIPYITAIHVTEHGAGGFEFPQCLQHFRAADVTRMPQLVNIFKEIEKLWYEGAMGVSTLRTSPVSASTISSLSPA